MKVNLSYQPGLFIFTGAFFSINTFTWPAGRRGSHSDTAARASTGGYNAHTNEEQHTTRPDFLNDCIIYPVRYKSDESTYLGLSQSANLTKHLRKGVGGLHKSTPVTP